MCVLPVIHFTLANKKLLIQAAGWKDLGKGLEPGLPLQKSQKVQKATKVKLLYWIGSALYCNLGLRGCFGLS